MLSSHKNINSSVFKSILPETLLIVITSFYYFVPLLVCPEVTVISQPVLSTLFFVFAFGIIESVIFCHIWKWCKISPEDESEFVKSKNSLKFFKGCWIFLGCFCVCHVVCVLFGAALTQYVQETATWALLVTSLIAIPNLCVFGSELEPWYRVIICGKFSNQLEQLLYFQCIGAVVGSWASAVVIPLDWDRNWQVWPIPCILGCVCGYIFSLVIHCVMVVRDLKRTKMS